MSIEYLVLHKTKDKAPKNANAPAVTAPAKDAKEAPPELPETDGMSYLVAENGIFKRVKNPFYDVIVPAKAATNLHKLEPKFDLYVGKLPYRILKQAEAFFRAVYQKHKSEAVVLLYANPEAKEWRMKVPPQKVRTSSLHVDYSLDGIPVSEDGYRLFGTIHSHAAASAFHSGTDDKDEQHFDGLHITIGNVDRRDCSYSLRWMLCGTAVKTELAEWVTLPPEEAVEQEWLNQVTEVVYTPAVTVYGGAGYSGYGVYGSRGLYGGDHDSWDALYDDQRSGRGASAVIGGGGADGRTFRSGVVEEGAKTSGQAGAAAGAQNGTGDVAGKGTAAFRGTTRTRKSKAGATSRRHSSTAADTRAELYLKWHLNDNAYTVMLTRDRTWLGGWVQELRNFSAFEQDAAILLKTGGAQWTRLLLQHLVTLDMYLPEDAETLYAVRLALDTLQANDSITKHELNGLYASLKTGALGMQDVLDYLSEPALDETKELTPAETAALKEQAQAQTPAVASVPAPPAVPNGGCDGGV